MATLGKQCSPQEESADSDQQDQVDSPIFNYHGTDSKGSPQFTVVQDDDPSLPPASADTLEEVRRTRRSVISAVALDDLVETDFPDKGKVPNKPEADVTRIMQQIKNIVLFEGYDEDELRLVADYMYLRKVTKGEVVISFGSSGDAIYVVKSGKFKCTVPKSGSDGSGQQITVRSYNDEGYFGELALINHAPRAASITAITDGEVWVLNALRSAWLRKNRAIFNAERFEQVIKAIPIFSNNLNPALTSRLIDALEVVHLPPGSVICNQGSPGDAMYFVMKGEVEVTIGNKAVKVMQRNEFFGERALVLDEGRAATCTAKTSVKLAKLPKESFCLIMPDSVVEQMRKYIAANYGTQKKGKK